MIKKSFKMFSFLIVFLFVFQYNFTIMNVKAAEIGSTYYVSNSGNDRNSGDINHPFKTIENGIREMKPGDTLLIRGGIYNEFVEISSNIGSPNAKYTLKNYNDEVVELNGLNSTGSKLSKAFTIYDCSYWTIDGLKIDNYSDAGIYLQGGSSHIDMQNLTIYNIDHTEDKPTGTCGIMGEGNTSYNTVRNCEIYNIGLTLNTQKDHGIYIGYGPSNWTFDSNRIHDNSGAGIHLYGDPTGGNYCTISNNVIYNNHTWGVVVSSNATGNSIKNNLFYNNKECDFYIAHSAYGNTIENNIFGTTNEGFNVVIFETSPDSNTFDHNVYTMESGRIVFTGVEVMGIDKWKASGQEPNGTYTSESQIPKEKVYTSKRLGGNSKLDNCKVIAEEYNNGIVNNVVIASSLDFPDALGGSLLASSLNAPILLVNDSVDESNQTIDYVKAHLSKDGTIYILGGTGAVNGSFESTLKASGYNNIKRVYGQNRYETNKAIYGSINSKKGTPLIIASGEDFPDALSISSVSGIYGYPIIITEKDNLSSQAVDIIKTSAPSTIYIAGGSAAVSDQVKNEILSVSGLSDNNVIRLWGKDRYETSMNIVKYFNIDTKNACFANGYDFQDALSGSVLATKLKAPTLLVQDGMDLSSQKDYIDTSHIMNLFYFGDSGVISDDLINSLRK